LGGESAMHQSAGSASRMRRLASAARLDGSTICTGMFVNTLSKGLVLLAVVGHIGFAVVDAYARGNGYGGGVGSAGSSGGGGYRVPGSGVVPSGFFGGGQDSEGTIGIGVQSGVGNGPPPPRTGDPDGPSGPDLDTASPGAAAAAAECAGGLKLSDVDSYDDALEGLAKISGETQRYVERCGCNKQACIADALDRYAEALKKVAPRLPPALRNIPAIVAAAAHRARTAPTRPAAAHVLRAAIASIRAAVHKTIVLMRAADSDAKSSATRGGDLVARTLSVAASALERADTL
jgi:hypothetical protein